MSRVKQNGNVVVVQKIHKLRIERKMNQATLASVIGGSVPVMSIWRLAK